MNSGRDKKRMNIEDDRLSNLPDDLIHKILSFIGFRQAIETSALSPRWRFMWKSQPTFIIKYRYCIDGFHSLEKADIRFSNPHDPIKTADLLQLLHSVKFLTLNLEILELLSSSVELIAHQPSPFANLKRLKIYPLRVHDWELQKEKVIVSTEVKKYLLDSSPSATFTMISREDVLAQRLIVQLRLLLEHEKYNIGTKKADMELGKATESHIAQPGKSQPETKMQLHNEKSLMHIMSCWNNLSDQVKKKKDKACHYSEVKGQKIYLQSCLHQRGL